MRAPTPTHTRAAGGKRNAAFLASRMLCCGAAAAVDPDCRRSYTDVVAPLSAGEADLALVVRPRPIRNHQPAARSILKHQSSFRTPCLRGRLRFVCFAVLQVAANRPTAMRQASPGQAPAHCGMLLECSHVHDPSPPGTCSREGTVCHQPHRYPQLIPSGRTEASMNWQWARVMVRIRAPGGSPAVAFRPGALVALVALVSQRLRELSGAGRGGTTA